MTDSKIEKTEFPEILGTHISTYMRCINTHIKDRLNGNDVLIRGESNRSYTNRIYASKMHGDTVTVHMMTTNLTTGPYEIDGISTPFTFKPYGTIDGSILLLIRQIFDNCLDQFIQLLDTMGINVGKNIADVKIPEDNVYGTLRGVIQCVKNFPYMKDIRDTYVSQWSSVKKPIITALIARCKNTTLTLDKDGENAIVQSLVSLFRDFCTACVQCAAIGIYTDVRKMMYRDLLTFLGYCKILATDAGQKHNDIDTIESLIEDGVEYIEREAEKRNNERKEKKKSSTKKV